MKNIDSWEKIAKKLMNLLCRVKDSELFHRPVDPDLLGIPDYFDIIKNPMDFATIKRKLNNLQYTNCKEFTDDIDLVFDNCYLYNGVSYLFLLLIKNFLLLILEIKYGWNYMHKNKGRI